MRPPKILPVNKSSSVDLPQPKFEYFQKQQEQQKANCFSSVKSEMTIRKRS